ncbi:MAG: hypothetical protein ABSG98_03020 [Anaerolineales bacterium]|jgi:hypothetical protein
MGVLSVFTLGLGNCAQGLTPESYPTSAAPPAITHTLSLVRTATPPRTPAATPDWVNTDPENPDTWPQWAQNYWQGPTGASPDQDTRFDTFLTESRRANLRKLVSENPEAARAILTHLAQGNFTQSFSPDQVARLDSDGLLSTVEHLSSQEVLVSQIILQAGQKKILHLAPDEIRTLQGDPQAGVAYWVDSRKNQAYGFWSGLGATSPATDLTSFVLRLKGDSYPATLFGRDTVVHRDAMWSPTLFDFAGVVELPAGQGYGLLGRFKTENTGENVLQLFALLQRPLSAGPKVSCFGILFPGPELGSCPTTTLPASEYALGARNYNWQPVNPEDLSQDLRWPPALLAASQEDLLATDPKTGNLSNYDGFLVNGLEAVGTFNLFQPSEGQNPE